MKRKLSIALIVIISVLLVACGEGTVGVNSDVTDEQKDKFSESSNESVESLDLIESVSEADEHSTKNENLNTCIWVKGQDYCFNNDIVNSSEKKNFATFSDNNIIDAIKESKINYENAYDPNELFSAFSEGFQLGSTIGLLSDRLYGAFTEDKDFFYFYPELSDDAYYEVGALQRISVDQMGDDEIEVETISTDVLMKKTIFLSSGAVIYLKLSDADEHKYDLHVLNGSGNWIIDSGLTGNSHLSASDSVLYYTKEQYLDDEKKSSAFSLFYVNLQKNAQPEFVDDRISFVTSDTNMRNRGNIPALRDFEGNIQNVYDGYFIMHENKVYYLKQSQESDTFELYMSELGKSKRIDTDITEAKLIAGKIEYLKENNVRLFDPEQYIDFSEVDSVKREELIYLMESISITQCKSLYELNIGEMIPNLISDSIMKNSTVKTAALGDTTAYLMQCFDRTMFKDVKGVSAQTIMNYEDYLSDPEDADESFIELIYINYMENKYNMTSPDIGATMGENNQMEERFREDTIEFVNKAIPIITKVGNGPLHKSRDCLADMEIDNLLDLDIDWYCLSFFDGGTGLLIYNRQTGNIVSTDINNKEMTKMNLNIGEDGLQTLFDSGCSEFEYIRDHNEYIYKNNHEICLGEVGSVTLRQYYRNLDLIFKGDHCIGEADLYMLSKEGEYQHLASGVSIAEVLEDDSILYIANGELVLYKEGIRKVIDEGTSMFWSMFEQKPLFSFENMFNDDSWTVFY